MIDQQEGKADQNKFRAQVASFLLVTSTGAIPVLLLLSTHYHVQEFWLGKAVPAILAALAAAIGTVMVMVKPQERWRLHRRYQRTLESECLKYQYLLPPYDKNADRALLKRLMEVREELLAEWLDLMPTSDAVKNAFAPEAKKK